ncbi:hypothetical protein BCR35DRAFT_329535 [Leucosporidium creatinivorum]|uniref:Insulin-like growth factor binding protein n=1 Tax=Leucosporidium creatinivorum TaxID=106004 RepID=A0A1Y2FZW4_9BASI|nr:hypothetical protein BCR35DRAFT_329535 [Leucosporidium creatinivorum]
MLLRLVSTTLAISALAAALPTAEFDKRATGAPRTCATGQYFLNSKCVSCTTLDSNASQCSASAGVTACATKYLTPSGTCSDPCPTGTYINGKACSPCDSLFVGSSECTASVATACSAPYYLSAGKCVSTCPATSYGSSTAPRACKTCSSAFGLNAQTCTESSITACRGRTHVSSDGLKCVGSCPTGTYVDSANTCAACPENALKCSVTAVLSCTEGFDPVGNTCVTSAPILTSRVLSRTVDLGLVMAATPLATSSNAQDLTEYGCYSFCAAQAHFSQQAYAFVYLADGQCSCPTSFYTHPEPVYKAGTAIVWDSFPTNYNPFMTFPATPPCQNAFWNGGQCEAIQYTSDGACFLTGTSTPCKKA